MANEMRLIDANAFSNEWWLAKFVEYKGRLRLVDTKRLRDIPTVDAKPVVHGRWVNVQTLGRGCVGFCSNCMTPHKANNATALRIDYRHCRWCGAKMDGDSK